MCGCGEPLRPWVPADQRPAADQRADETLSPNERIQQQRHQAAAARVWPQTWNGHQTTPAR